MDHNDLEFERNIHEVGIAYIHDLLDGVGFRINDVNKDPDHHFQLFAQKKDRAMLIAVRTACHPDVGKIDITTKKKLIEESKQLNATPYFAGLSLTVTKVNDIQVEDIIKGEEYNIIFNGMTVVR